MSKKFTIGEVRHIAKSRGGKCLSGKYCNSKDKLKWECGTCGHIWETSLSNVVNRNSWCPECAKKKCGQYRKLTIEDMYKIAELRGGKYLSDTYVGSNVKSQWECGACGYIWLTTFDSIRQGSWCPKCAGNLKGTIEEMQFIASKRGGRCLSGTYNNARTKLKWECIVGHSWFATPSDIKQGSWCPICCTKNRSEEVCRLFLEKAFSPYTFSKTRPFWLNGLELDGYNEELRLAFEHQGRQHYQYNEKFHSNLREFKNQKKRDNQKKLLCKKHGVFIIIVPELHRIIKLKHLDSYVYNQIKDTRYVKIYNKQVDIKECFGVVNYDYLQELKEFAISKGGKLLSSEYITSATKLKWECEHGHNWKATPNSVKNGSWCSICAGNKKLTIEDLRKTAEGKGLNLLTLEYKNKDAIMQWECAEGHIWNASSNSIRRGSGCPVCAGVVKGTLNEMQKIAKDRGGKCLSEEYINAHTKLKWECVEGHIGEAAPMSIKHNNSWCPECANNNRVVRNKVYFTETKITDILRLKFEECVSLKEIEKRYGVSRAVITRVIKENQHQLTEDDKKEIVLMRQQGVPWKKIEMHIKCLQSTMKAAVKDMYK